MACMKSSVGRMSSQSTHASRPRLFNVSSKRRTKSLSLREWEMKTSGIFCDVLLRSFEFSRAWSNSTPKWRRHISKPAGLMSIIVHAIFVIGKRDLEAETVRVRVHGKGNVSAKLRSKALTTIVQCIKEHQR